MNRSIRFFTSHQALRASLTKPILQTRTYATSAPQKGVKPPIIIHSLEGTYASALYSASAQSNQTLSEIEKALTAIRQKLNSDQKLQTIVFNPALPQAEKLQIVELLTRIGAVGTESSKSIKNLLTVMGENGRLAQIGGVVDAFQKIMRAHKGEVDVIVTSAQPLDHTVLKKLEQSISKSSLIQKGQKVKMENKVSETILGGLIVEIGDRTIDLSVQSRVSKLNQLLYETL